jgi:ferric-dicitrate binding protein FerR (iron transport regulator)
LPENKKEFEKLKATWNMTAQADSLSDLDVDAAWKKVQTRMHEPKQTVVRNINEAPGYVQPKTNWLLRIAAVMIPALMVSFLIWQYGKNDVKQLALSSGMGRIEQTLPDGSVIYLAPNSSFEYPEMFDDNARTVKLKGEAFFEITKDANRPFTIVLEGAEVRVLGTSFNIKAFSKEQTVVIVETGKVLFSGVNKVELEKGDKGKMDSSGSVSKSRSVEADYYSHKTQTLVFENTDLKKVIEVLNAVYSAQIILENENIGNCRLTATFSEQDLDSVLEVIAATFNLSVSKEVETIQLSGHGCE